jgi:tRNA-(ms[2]io[6]A)-hydroxylase
MAERRRLPVLQQEKPPVEAPDPDGADETRPPLHWIGFGVVAIFAAWLPLTYLAGAASAKVIAARFGKDASKDAIALATSTMTSDERARLMAIVALPTILALAIAAFAGGFVVGRFGTGNGTRTAASAGAITAAIASLMAWSGVTSSALIGALVTVVVAIAFAAWGGRVGAARRPSHG